MGRPIDILIEVGLNAAGKRGVDYYAENVINAIADLDDKNRYTLFSYFFRDFEAKKARLPNPRKGNFDLVVRRLPESIIHPLEWGLKLPLIENLLIPKRDYKIYHTLTGGTLPQLKGPKGISTFFDLQSETMPEDPSKAPGVGKIAAPQLYDVARRCDYIVATGKKTKENLMKYYGIPGEKIEIIHTGINLKTFSPLEDPPVREAARKRLNLPNRYLMLIGPYVPPWRTNGSYVIRAFAQLKKEGVTAGCKLAFVGSANAHLQELLTLGRSLGIGEDMVSIGYVALEDLAAVYSLSEAVVHPTSVEGFGYGMEVFASGAPLITSNVPGVLEAVGDCALTVPPQQVEPLREAMREILQDPAVGDELRRKGLARAPNYSYERVAEKMIALYERAAVGR